MNPGDSKIGVRLKRVGLFSAFERWFWRRPHLSASRKRWRSRDWKREGKWRMIERDCRSVRQRKREKMLRRISDKRRERDGRKIESRKYAAALRESDKK